jgi:hypothetical protein
MTPTGRENRMNGAQNGVPHPHDLLVRNILGDADLAAEFFRHYLPPELVANLDLDDLRREAAESIAPGLSELLCDLRFSGKFKDGGRDLRVFLFLEHQSRPDRLMAFRFLEYVWTFEGNQTNRCLISFKVSGHSFQRRFFAPSPVWVELTKNQPIGL